MVAFLCGSRDCVFGTQFSRELDSMKFLEYLRAVLSTGGHYKGLRLKRRNKTGNGGLVAPYWYEVSVSENDMPLLDSENVNCCFG
eukprot:IDg6798t1